MKLLNKLSDYIHYFENILNLSVCDQIVNDSTKKEFVPAPTGTKTNKNNYRNCYTKPLNKKYDSIIFKAVGNVLLKYQEKHNFFKYNFLTNDSMQDTGYTHLLYKGDEKGEYKIHIDHYDVHPRVLSISLILTDNYEGGDFCFFEKNNFFVKKKKGSAIVFPSNFCFPHAVTPVLGGDRHSIVTWIR